VRMAPAPADWDAACPALMETGLLWCQLVACSQQVREAPHAGLASPAQTRFPVGTACRALPTCFNFRGRSRALVRIWWKRLRGSPPLGALGGTAGPPCCRDPRGRARHQCDASVTPSQSGGGCRGSSFAMRRKLPIDVSATLLRFHGRTSLPCSGRGSRRQVAVMVPPAVGEPGDGARMSGRALPKLALRSQGAALIRPRDSGEGESGTMVIGC
jgi:hypothetical protein